MEGKYEVTYYDPKKCRIVSYDSFYTLFGALLAINHLERRYNIVYLTFR